MIEFITVLQLLLGIGGFFTGLIVDRIWMRTPVIQKYERGLEAFEHYHLSLIFLIIFVVINNFIQHDLSFILIGLGIAFYLAEWKQSAELNKAKTEIIAGHEFAYGSVHFKESTIIGIILTGILLTVTTITLYFYSLTL